VPFHAGHLHLSHHPLLYRPPSPGRDVTGDTGKKIGHWWLSTFDPASNTISAFPTTKWIFNTVIYLLSPSRQSSFKCIKKINRSCCFICKLYLILKYTNFQNYKTAFAFKPNFPQTSFNQHSPNYNSYILKITCTYK
jgi:hypothetical protein